MYITENKLIYMIKNNIPIYENLFYKKCIIIIDMCKFTKNLKIYGLQYTLKKIYKLRNIINKINNNYGGYIFKYDADNIYILHDNPLNGIYFSIYLNDYLKTTNIKISIGIGYGDIIIYYKNNYDIDIYGLEVNYTSYLVEDYPTCNEILLTKNLYNYLKSINLNFNIDIIDENIYKLDI